MRQSEGPESEGSPHSFLGGLDGQSEKDVVQEDGEEGEGECADEEGGLVFHELFGHAGREDLPRPGIAEERGGVPEGADELHGHDDDRVPDQHEDGRSELSKMLFH